MIVCPNCSHQNPDGAVQCEACYTPLPSTASCPNCGSTVQADASFCGQCGFNLQAGEGTPVSTPTPAGVTIDLSPLDVPELDLPDLALPDPLVEPTPLPSGVGLEVPDPQPGVETPSLSSSPAVAMSDPLISEAGIAPSPIGTGGETVTQLQQQTVRLLHVQTNTLLELPQNVSVVHLGKPNDRIPPDIDMSGFPNSEIVSRIHADIRIEADAYYIEDVGSSNGTYINNLPLSMGNRHRLRPGDRISLGKGDKVTFLFQLS